MGSPPFNSSLVLLGPRIRGLSLFAADRGVAGGGARGRGGLGAVQWPNDLLVSAQAAGIWRKRARRAGVSPWSLARANVNCSGRAPYDLLYTLTPSARDGRTHDSTRCAAAWCAVRLGHDALQSSAALASGVRERSIDCVPDSRMVRASSARRLPATSTHRALIVETADGSDLFRIRGAREVGHVELYHVLLLTIDAGNTNTVLAFRGHACARTGGSPRCWRRRPTIRILVSILFASSVLVRRRWTASSSKRGAAADVGAGGPPRQFCSARAGGSGRLSEGMPPVRSSGDVAPPHRDASPPRDSRAGSVVYFGTATTSTCVLSISNTLAVDCPGSASAPTPLPSRGATARVGDAPSGA